LVVSGTRCPKRLPNFWHNSLRGHWCHLLRKMGRRAAHAVLLGTLVQQSEARTIPSTEYVKIPHVAMERVGSLSC
jgi:hypothetical protein